MADAGPRLLVDDGSFVPLAEQVRRGIIQQVRSGALHPGDRLPTVRQLARDLVVAPGTVAKAYQLLEADGVLEARGRRGSFIARILPNAAVAPPRLEDAARRYLAEAARLGGSTGDAVAAVIAAAAAAEGESSDDPGPPVAGLRAAGS